ncbi:MAG: hypothetical protein DBX59_08045 [Bacillota bacterium]|nr:MAG: hypothetical protein DBX59_08045 [Bacillota bacterium]
MKNISFLNVKLDGGFWKSRYDLNAEVSLQSVYKRFEETDRFNGLRFKGGDTKVDIFYDSDAAKWIEAVAYLVERNGGYEREQEIIDEIAEKMAQNRLENGYINSYFIAREPQNIFTRRQDHELYCAGHLIEAAIAYKRATGKTKLFDIMLDYVDFIERAFITEKTARFTTCGHEEIEIALLKLYEYTENKRYLDMAMFFLNERGRKPENCYEFALDNYDQSNAPVRELKEAEGHAVRAAYLYTAMSDAAFITGDKSLLSACETLFDDIVDKKMYITGGIGSNRVGEAFTVPYDLPNLEAYSESCAAIGLLLFALSMQKHGRNAKYADVIERVMYNNLLSSTSLNGREFFYENPLEIHLASVDKQTSIAPQGRTPLPIAHRLEVFGCSCCPPNINRIFARIGDVFFSEEEDALVVNQFACVTLKNEKTELTMKADFAKDGKTSLSLRNNRYKRLYVRKPSWCDKCETTGHIEGDYIVFENIGETFATEIDFCMRPYFAECNPDVRDNCGRIALCYGPTVYCLEAADNPQPLNGLSVRVDADAEKKAFGDEPHFYAFIAEGEKDADFGGLYRKAKFERERVLLTFRPYWTFANREKCDMLVWVRRA